jgi:peptide/nickel transport system substrate-binding protein
VRRQRRSLKLLALILGFSLIAAACGGDDDDDAGSSTDDSGGGGELVVGAEQEGECLDWINTCGGSSWNFWMAGVTTMPRVYDIVQDGENWVYEPSILLDGEPELVTDPQQVVTYHISEDAVWSDGEPIVCGDFVYTWDQIKNGEAIYDTTGYKDISAVDCPDDKTAVTTYENPYAGWKSLFGTQFGVFPSHILEGQDRHEAMNDGYDWSGGPWKIDEWARGEQLVLVPNENYWGDKPKLERVTFRFITDSSAEFEAFTGGEVDAIYPQPQPDSIEQIQAGIDGADVMPVEDSPNAEALWINNQKFPFDSKAVRQAFAYAFDRDAVVERLFGALGINEAQNTFNAPILGDFGNPQAFGIYTQDLDKVDELMTGDGWTKGSDGIWEKGGQKADIVIKTTAGNARRELTEDILEEQAKEAGFNLTDDNQEAGDLFGTQLPAGDFQVALYAQVLTSLEPSVCNLFCVVNIPTQENGLSGNNWSRTNIPAAEAPLLDVDLNANEEERSASAATADDLLAEDATSLPLDPLPQTFIIRSTVKGEKTNNPIYGPFNDMNGWSF